LTPTQPRIHLHHVRYPGWKYPIGALLGLTLFAPWLAAAIGEKTYISLPVVRSKDQVTIHASNGLLSLVQNIVLETQGVQRTTEPPGSSHLVELLIYPLWIKEGESLRPAFPVLRPRLTLSHGRVRRFTLVHPDGESVGSMAKVTPDCAYVLSLEFGHVIPRRFTVTLDFATGGIRRETELRYMASNDGQPIRTGPAESTYTELRVFPDGSLQPWHAVQGERYLPRVNSATVHLERGVDHVIRFGPPALSNP